LLLVFLARCRLRVKLGLWLALQEITIRRQLGLWRYRA